MQKLIFSYFLNHYKKMGAVGVEEITVNLYVNNHLIDNLFYHCAECDMPVIIHMSSKKYDYYGIIDETGLLRLEKNVEKSYKVKNTCPSF